MDCPILKTNRFATRVVAPLTNATERFYESNNVQDSRSPYGWKKRVGIKRRWPSTFSLDALEVDNSFIIGLMFRKR